MGEWYTVKIDRGYYIFEVKAREVFNVKNLSFSNPKIIYTYKKIVLNKEGKGMDTSTELIKVSDHSYKVEPHSSVSNESIFTVMIFEGDY